MSGRESIAHINKNPLTSGTRKQATIDERLSGRREGDGWPYAESSRARLESSGKMSISLTASQIRIGSRPELQTPAKNKQTNRAANAKEGSRDCQVQAMISKFSDEFGEASNLLVSNESPEGAGLEIKNLKALSKKGYRRG